MLEEGLFADIHQAQLLSKVTDVSLNGFGTPTEHNFITA